MCRQDAGERRASPRSEYAIIAELRNCFLEIVGEELDSDKDVYVVLFDHGGMSSGVVCSGFWHRKAIPLLIDRPKVGV